MSRIIIALNLHIKYIYNMEKKTLTFRLDKDTIRRLKYVALDQEKNLTALLYEGIHYIIEKYENTRTSSPNKK